MPPSVFLDQDPAVRSPYSSCSSSSMQWSPQSLHSDESSCTTDTSGIGSDTSGIGNSVTEDNQQQQPQPKEPETVLLPAGVPPSPVKKLTVIARHRRLGEESLSRLKEEVRRYALDHTFKETAKKFGIHHSTVSGWVKARERVCQSNLSLLRTLSGMYLC